MLGQVDYECENYTASIIKLAEKYGKNFVSDYYGDYRWEGGLYPSEEDLTDYDRAYEVFKFLLSDFEYGESIYSSGHNTVIGAVSAKARTSESNNMNYLLRRTGWDNEIKKAYRDAVRDRKVWMYLRYQ